MTIINHYKFSGTDALFQKPCVKKLDTASYPLRTALGGKIVRVHDGAIVDNSKPSLAKRILCIVLMILFVPVLVVSAAALLLKKICYPRPQLQAKAPSKEDKTKPEDLSTPKTTEKTDEPTEKPAETPPSLEPTKNEKEDETKPEDLSTPKATEKTDEPRPIEIKEEPTASLKKTAETPTSLEPTKAEPPVQVNALKTPTWRKTSLTTEQVMKKMWKNAQKAVEEHIKAAPEDDKASYLPLAEALPSEEERNKENTSITISQIYQAELQGRRKSMEDAKFVIDTPTYTLAGVFDGHAGALVANYMNTEVQKRFNDLLEQLNGHIHQTLEVLFQEVHESVAKHDFSFITGTTAVVCYLDKKKGELTTATLADSEAHIYRKTPDGLKAIPVSCVRNWASPKDAKRAADCMKEPSIATEWPKQNPKSLRYPRPEWGVNVSRALGDRYIQPPKGALTHKPKITLNKIIPGDTLVVACDGLKDYTKEKDVIECLSKKPADPAKALTELAYNKRSGDNITVVVIETN